MRRQDKKLKEGFARLQQENEALRAQLAQLAGRGAPVSLPPALGGLQGLCGPSGGRPGTALAARCGMGRCAVAGLEGRRFGC